MDWVKEGELVDVKIGEKIKVARVLKINLENFVVGLDENEENNGVVKPDQIFRFRDRSCVQDLKEFARFSRVRMRKVEEFVNGCLERNGLGESSKVLQGFRGDIPVFVYGLINEKNVEHLKELSSGLKALILNILKINLSALKVVLRFFNAKENNKKKEDKLVADSWPEILNIIEILLGNSSLFKEILESISPSQKNEPIQPQKKMNLIQSSIINSFIENGGFQDILSLFQNASNFPISLVLSIELRFYFSIFPVNLENQSVSKICQNFVALIRPLKFQEINEGDLLKIFNNLKAVIKSEKPASKEAENLYLDLVFMGFFSDVLNKRAASLNELCDFSETRVLNNEKLFQIESERNILEDILERRLHYYILKTGIPIIVFFAEHKRLQERHFAMIEMLQNSKEKKILEVFRELIRSIFPYLDSQNMKKFESFDERLIFYTEENGEKVFDFKVFCESLSRCKEKNELKRKVSQIAEVVSKDLILQKGFIENYLIHIQDFKNGFFSVKLLRRLFKLKTEDFLNVLHQEYSLYKGTVRNLEEYLLSVDTSQLKSGKSVHEEQISARLKLIEYSLKNSKFLMSERTEEKLFLIVLKSQDEILQIKYKRFIYNRCFYRDPIINPDLFLSWYSSNIPLPSVDFFKVFKAVFLKANSGVSLHIENSRFLSVLSRGIKGIETLFKQLYVAENIKLRYVKKMIRKVLTCYSNEIQNEIYEIFNENIQLLSSIIENNGDFSRFIAILYDLVELREDPKSKNVNVSVQINNDFYNVLLPERATVQYVRFVISRCNESMSLNETSFLYQEKVYGSSFNSKYLSIAENSEIVCLKQEGIFELSHGIFPDLLEMYKYSIWEFAFLGKSLNEQALSVARKLGSSQGLKEKIRNLELSDDQITIENIHVYVQVIFELPGLLDSQEFVEKAKVSQIFLAILKNTKVLLNYNNIFSIIIQDLMRIFNSSIKVINNTDYEAAILIYLESWKWLYSNLNDQDFFQTFKIFKDLTQSLYDFDKNFIEERMVNFMNSNKEDIINKLLNEKKDSKNLEIFAHYMSYYLSLSNLTKFFIDSTYTQLSQSVQNTELNIILLVYKKILFDQPNKNPIQTKDLLNRLLILQRSIFEFHDANNNLSFILKILSKNSEILENFDFFGFLNETLFPASGQNKRLRCLFQNSRKKAFSLLTSLCKTRKDYLNILLNLVSGFIKDKTWRICDWKHLSIPFQSSKRSFSKPSELNNGEMTQFLGIRNPSSICYSNSLLQQLFHLPMFQKIVLNSDPSNPNSSEILIKLKRIFCKLKSSNKPSVSGKSLIKAIDGFPNYSEQKDVSEYLLTLLNILKDNRLDCKVLIEMCFGASQVSEYRCTRCDFIRIKREFFFTLDLNLDSNSLNTSLENRFSEEMLDGGNEIWCSVCDMKAKSRVIHRLEKLPNYLIFSLKRYDYEAGSKKREKLNKKFEFKENLDLKEFVVGGYDQCTGFRLRGVIMHMGESDKGHYYSYVRDGSDWLEFNDQNVEKIERTKMLEKAIGTNSESSAYVLIYEKDEFFISKLEEKLLNKLTEKKQEESLTQGTIEKNYKSLLKEIVFSESFCKFMYRLCDLEGNEMVIFKYFLFYFIRIDFKDDRLKMKMYKKFYEKFNIDCLAYFLNIIQTELGFREFVLFNFNPEFKKLIMLISKKFIGWLNVEFINSFLATLVSRISSFHRCKIDASEFFYEIISFFCSYSDDFAERFGIITYLIDVLCRRFPPFYDYPANNDTEDSSQEYSNISTEVKLPPIRFTYILKFLSLRIYLLSEQNKDTLKHPAFINQTISILESKSELIHFSILYSNLYDSNIEAALNHLNFLLDTSATYLLRRLRLISLFISNYNQRLEILPSFFENYFILISDEFDELNMLRIKYSLKILKKVTCNEISNYLSEDTLTKLRLYISNYHISYENTYHSQKLQKYYEKFVSESQNFVWDSDEEIEEKHIQVSKTVYYSRPGLSYSQKAKVIDKLEDDLILLEIENGRSFKIVDQNNYDSILLPLSEE